MMNDIEELKPIKSTKDEDGVYVTRENNKGENRYFFLTFDELKQLLESAK